MTSQLKKLKGSSVKTLIGQIVFKQYYRLDDSQFDQIYFKTNGIESICKIYDLTQPASIQRFNNEKQQYNNKSLTMIYNYVHCQQVKIKKNNYGLVIFQKLDKEQSLHQCMVNMSVYQKYKLTIKLMELLVQLKQNHKIFCNIRPSNIYKTGDGYVIINTEFLRGEGTRNNMDSFMLQKIENDWKYWPGEIVDTYSNQFFDHSLDVYAVGCVLYECITSKYPFQSKLSATNGQYIKLDPKDILSKVAEYCLQPSAQRRTLNIKQVLIRLKKYLNELHPVQNNTAHQQKYRKGSNNGIFQNISNVFTKMMNDSQGWYLNYVQDNDLAPDEKYLDNILTKMYKKQQKADKLHSIMQRFIANNPGKINSMKKILLLIGQAIRKGPQAALNLIPIITTIKIQYQNVQQIIKFASILQKKVQLNQKLKKILSGNYFLHQIGMFKNLSISDLKMMSNYLGYLIKQASGQLLQNNNQLSQSLSNFVCDQIYDLVSMIIISTISIRKDNQLQLRSDNMIELKPIQKDMNVYLKKLSYLSNIISAHAIYSLQGQYIPYQQQLMLKSNPYYSTLQYFYYNNKSYKGLTVPNDYASVFTGSKQQKKVYSANKEVKTSVQQNGKNYFRQQINSDEDDQFSRSQKTLTLQNQQKKSEKKIQTTNGHVINIKQPQIKRDNKPIKIKRQDTSPSKGNKSSKAQLTISFQQFGNIHQTTDKTPKNFNQFAFFNEIKNQTVKKPPLPQKLEPHLKQKQQKIKSNFYQFDQIFDKKQNKTKNNPELKVKKDAFLQFNQVTQNRMPLNFDAFNEVLLKPTEPVNPLVKKILQQLKLKQLKDLIIKNKKYVIDFGQLKLEKVIGSGSAGEVYYGLYKQQKVAIKKVKAKQNPNALKQFERQLVTYIKIKTNPHLVSLVGLSLSNTDFYLITQFCSQGSLFDLLHKKKLQVALSWKQRLNFAIQIAQGMHFLHSMNPIIIHRDLKSLNVFITKNGNSWKMKVADFGLSRSPQAQMMTTQLGTIHWMAPELLQSKQYSYKVDVYSYGILLWEILARTTPYSNLLNPVAILKYVVFDKNRPDKQVIPKQCPAQLLQIMQKCWAHEPNDRPPFSQIIKLLKMINL